MWVASSHPPHSNDQLKPWRTARVISFREVGKMLTPVFLDPEESFPPLPSVFLFGCKMSFSTSYAWVLGPQLMVLFGEVVGPLGGGFQLEEPLWRTVLEDCGLACFWHSHPLPECKTTWSAASWSDGHGNKLNVLRLGAKADPFSLKLFLVQYLSVQKQLIHPHSFLQLNIYKLLGIACCLSSLIPECSPHHAPPTFYRLFLVSPSQCSRKVLHFVHTPTLQVSGQARGPSWLQSL